MNKTDSLSSQPLTRETFEARREANDRKLIFDSGFSLRVFLLNSYTKELNAKGSELLNFRRKLESYHQTNEVLSS